jgi:hypothetical protein
MRYMSDVRHPLKYMGDDRPQPYAHAPGPFWKGKPPDIPRVAKCPLCGKDFDLTKAHGCMRSMRFRR